MLIFPSFVSTIIVELASPTVISPEFVLMVEDVPVSESIFTSPESSSMIAPFVTVFT